jgi:hypothetical protein
MEGANEPRRIHHLCLLWSAGLACAQQAAIHLFGLQYPLRAGAESRADRRSEAGDTVEELSKGGCGVSYDIYLKDPVTHQAIEFDEPHQMTGGTYQLGGCREAWLNVTYNYGRHYCRVFPSLTEEAETGFEKMFGHGHSRGIRTIYGKTGAESIPLLESAIAQLGDDVYSDYWKPTEGNAKRALCQLLALAKLRPDGIWDGD